MLKISTISFSVFIFVSIFLSSALSGTWVDNFDDGDLDGWHIYVFDDFAFKEIFNVEKKCKVENGIVIIGDENPNIGHGVSMIKPESCFTWTDYTAEVSFRLPKPMRNTPNGSLVQIFVRTKPNSISCYSLGIWNFNGEFAVASIITDWNDITVAKIPFSAEANIWYRLKMTTDGNLISCFVDEKKITEFVDNNHPTGAAGFGAEGVVTEFDNFIVSGPEVPGNRIGQSVDPSGKLSTTWANIKVSN